MVSVILSFDTEDFVTPESDDALLMLARELAKRDICGCFALVGDKVRALRERSRRDVLEQVAVHEVDYHSNDHNFFPPTATTIEKMGWEDGLRWVLAHEAPGVADLEGILGQRPTAWVRTDSHWTTQSLHAYRLLGMRVYAARHFARETAQPWWYEDLLTVPYIQMLEHFIAEDGSPRAILDLAAADFERRVEAAGQEDVIVYGTHPCMWVCQTFYDIHNCKRRGHLPAKEKWQPAPLLPADRIGRNRRFFPMFLGYLQGSGVEFITYRQLMQRFDEPSNEWLTRAQLGSLARQVTQRFAAAQSGDRYYSVAEVLAALCWALERYEDGALPAHVPVRRLLGPVETPRRISGPLQVCARAVVGAAGKADAYIEANHRLPAGIDVGGHHFTTAQLLFAAAQSYLAILAKGKPCGAVLQPGEDCPQEQSLLEGATIGAYSLPKGYRPERLLEQGRLQSWTLKPATVRKDDEQ